MSVFQICYSNLPSQVPVSSIFQWCCLLCCTRWFLLLRLWMESLSVTIQMKATENYFSVVHNSAYYAAQRGSTDIKEKRKIK